MYHHYVDEQSLDNIDSVITYLNGYLSLLIKNQKGALVLVDRVQTAALEEKYKIIKSIAHVSAECTLVMRSMMKTQEKTIQHEQHLRIINKQMLGLHKTVKADMGEHLVNVCKILKHIKRIRMFRSMEELPCIKAQLLRDVQSINDAYRENAADIQWDGMSHIINNWRSTHRIPLDRTHIVIACSKGPKKNLLELQFFHDLYEQEGLSNGEESDHILDLEMLPKQLSSVTNNCLITALKSKLLNAELAIDMLEGNKKGMEEDVLGLYAKRRRTAAKSCPHNISTSRHSIFARKKETIDFQPAFQSVCPHQLME